jgi:uncharacterized membrane protein
VIVIANVRSRGQNTFVIAWISKSLESGLKRTSVTKEEGEHRSMAEVVPVFAQTGLSVRKLEMDQPWSWLRKGWQDCLKTPGVSFTYGVLAAVTGYVITWGLFASDMTYLVLPFVAGFLIVGPILAVGLYEASRRSVEGKSTTMGQALGAFQRNPSQIALMGMALLLLMIFWARIAAVLFFLYFGLEPPDFSNLFVETFLSADSWPFLVIGSAIGAVFALVAFSISVISIPMLLDRNSSNVIEAIATSVRAVQANPMPMLLWAGLIVIFTLAGLVTLYLGLIVTLPLIGHATWHAYRDIVVFGEA